MRGSREIFFFFVFGDIIDVIGIFMEPCVIDATFDNDVSEHRCVRLRISIYSFKT